MSTDSTGSVSVSASHPHTDTFTCLSCGLTVGALAPDGSRRNHCPSCLHSRHTADGANRTDGTDDGAAACRGRMAPISVAVLRGGGWLLVHRCSACDALTAAPVSPDDNRLVLVRMAVRPLAQPPFPLEAFGDL